MFLLVFAISLTEIPTAESTSSDYECVTAEVKGISPSSIGVKKDSYETALEALEKVGLKEKHNRVPDELSGGEKQRVAIARAIAKKPHTLFADEPCANLDTDNSKQILDVFKELNEKYNQTIVIVTHEPWHTKYVGRVITLEDGYLISDENRSET